MNKNDLIAFEKRIAQRFDNGEIPYLTHFSGGNEDQLIQIFRQNIKKGDYIFSTHRSHYHYLLAGGSPKRLEDLILRGKSMFVFDRALNFYSSSIVCSTPSIAAGVAWALKKKGSPKRVWCFVGDGAEDEGHLCEAARYVDGWDLPCTFVIEDNDRSVGTSKAKRWGNHVPLSFRSILRYEYCPTYPHGGSGTSGWLQFKNQPKLESFPRSYSHVLSDIDINISYKDASIKSMGELSAQGYIFVGYNVGSAYGTLDHIPEYSKLETPLAENLMTGLAIGMTMEGYLPVLYFERHDFLFNALDALVHQVDMIDVISDGEFTAPMIIKAVVGGVHPFYAGMTHIMDYVPVLRKLFSFPVLAPVTGGEMLDAYYFARRYDHPVLVSERKELY